MNVTIDYPIIRDGTDDGYAKFKWRGDFIVKLSGTFNDLDKIEKEINSITSKSSNVELHCTKDYI